MVKITADSTCDLPPALLKELDVTLVPLGIMVDDQLFHDGVGITSEDIFRYFEEGKACKTAAVSIGEYDTLFQELAETYDEVVHINIGSAFSVCYQNAVLAAERYPHVYVVDSKNLSSGSGHLVVEAAKMAANGASAQNIFDRLQAMIPLIDASFVIDRLDYLHRGGRCSGVERLGARFFLIKPTIEVIDGELKVGKKYRGKFKQCLQAYVSDRLQEWDNIDQSLVFITHARCSDDTVELVKTILQEESGFETVIETRAGCTVSAHCGPDTLGILYLRKTPKVTQAVTAES